VRFFRVKIGFCQARSRNDNMAEKSGATRRRFYTATEVTNHNSENDCWVSIFHKVYDLTEFLSFNKGESELRIDAGTPRGAQPHAYEPQQDTRTHAGRSRGVVRIPQRMGHAFTHVWGGGGSATLVR